MKILIYLNLLLLLSFKYEGVANICLKGKDPFSIALGDTIEFLSTPFKETGVLKGFTIAYYYDLGNQKFLCRNKVCEEIKMEKNFMTIHQQSRIIISEICISLEEKRDSILESPYPLINIKCRK